RVEISGLDSVARQKSIAEMSGRAIDVVADEDVIAGLQHGQQRGGDRRHSRRNEADACALLAFQRRQCILQGPGGRSAVPSVMEFSAMGMEVIGGRVEY